MLFDRSSARLLQSLPYRSLCAHLLVGLEATFLHSVWFLCQLKKLGFECKCIIHNMTELRGSIFNSRSIPSYTALKLVWRLSPMTEVREQWDCLIPIRNEVIALEQLIVHRLSGDGSANCVGLRDSRAEHGIYICVPFRLGICSCCVTDDSSVFVLPFRRWTCGRIINTHYPIVNHVNYLSPCRFRSTG